MEITFQKNVCVELSFPQVKLGRTYKLESYIIQVYYQFIWVWRKCTVDIDKQCILMQLSTKKLYDLQKLISS